MEKTFITPAETIKTKPTIELNVLDSEFEPRDYTLPTNDDDAVD